MRDIDLPLYRQMREESPNVILAISFREPESKWIAHTLYEVAKCYLLAANCQYSGQLEFVNKNKIDKPNPKLAMQYFEKTLSKYDKNIRDGHEYKNTPCLLSALVLGDIWLNGRFDVKQDKTKGKKYYEWAADRGHGPACEFLGESYYHGKNGLDKNLELAAKYYKVAFEDETPWEPICYPYGFMILHQQGGLKLDYKVLVSAYSKAVSHYSNGSAPKILKECCRVLAEIYESGKPNVPQDKEKACFYYQVLDSHGDPYGQYKMGIAYYHGNTGTHLDHNLIGREAKAVECFREAEKNEEPNATTFLGYMYERGKGGLPESKSEALRLYQLAAARKNATGAVNAGIFFEYGTLGPINLPKALEFYELAKALGDSTSADPAINRVRNQIAKAEEAKKQAALQEAKRKAAEEEARKQAALEEATRKEAQEKAKIKATPALSLNTQAIAQQLEIPFNQLEIAEKLGEGGFGVVCKGTYEGREIAVKTLRSGFLEGDKLLEFNHEMKTMHALRHKSIISLLGVSTDSKKNRYLVLEFAPMGSLRTVLNDAKITLSIKIDLEIMKGITDGLGYLHGQKFLHRDIKSLNVLMFNGFKPKLADFGLSKFVASSTQCYTADPKGSLLWMAPENFQDPNEVKFTGQSDVYSMIMVFYEILSGALPFQNLPHAGLIIGAIIQGKVPTIPDRIKSNEAVPEKLKALMQRGWSLSPTNRPSTQAISDELDAIQTSFKKAM